MLCCRPVVPAEAVWALAEALVIASERQMRILIELGVIAGLSHQLTSDNVNAYEKAISALGIISGLVDYLINYIMCI